MATLVDTLQDARYDAYIRRWRQTVAADANKEGIMQVICLLREIQERLDLTKADLKRELGIDARALDKLLADSDDDPWRLDRDVLHRLFLFAHEHGFEQPFRVEPNPIWKDFEDSEGARIFRGTRKSDVPVESHLLRYLERLHSEKTHSTTTFDGVEEAMKLSNCVFIGSPKASPASEIALARLWDAEPFDDQSKNRGRIPIHFLGMRPEQKPTSALLEESTRHGFNIQCPGVNGRSYLKVDWLPLEKYAPYKGSGQDAAILVICRQPLGTKENVTTILIAGYTGLSTLVAAQEITSKKIPDLKAEEHPGQPCFAALKFRFRKKPQYRRSLDNLRTAEEGSAKWAPPWGSFFS
jgi:hypothetical protein